MDPFNRLQNIKDFLSDSQCDISLISKNSRVRTCDANTSPAFKNDIVLNDPLSAPLDQPLSREKEKLLTHLVKTKIQVEGETITCHNKRGRPFTMTQTHRSTVDLEQASASTQYRKNKEVQRLKKATVGSGKKSLTKQLENEFKRLGTETKQRVFSAAGAKSKVKVSNETFHDLKVSGRFSYSQLNVLRDYFKPHIAFPGEGKQRKREKDLTFGDYEVVIDEFEESETATTVDGKKIKRTVIKEKPLGIISNLSEFLISYLDALKENNLLKWHNTIPEDEVWVKIGGDHGRGTFKLTMQVANVEKPNSKTNTIVFAYGEVVDSHENLRKIMNNFETEINSMQGMMWEGKAIKIFLFGDYKFYTSLYGLSGAAGVHPCLWCTATRLQMKSNNQGTHCPRTIEKLKDSYYKFELEGNLNLDLAKYYQNCVDLPMLMVPIDRVAPPILHILLGLMKKHHELLEQLADRLDQMIVEQDPSKAIGEALSFRRKGSNWQKGEEIRQQTEFLKVNKKFFSLGADIEIRNETRESYQKLKQKFDDIPFKELEQRNGPISSQLDPIMEKAGVVYVKQFNRSYLGNHCHKYFMEKVFEKCSEAIVEKTEALTMDDDIINFAKQQTRYYDQLNNAYRDVHINVSHCEPITDDDRYQTIETAITDYMTLYRLHHASKVTPKHHILEHHCLPWIRTYKFGLGFHSESGGELCHSSIRTAEVAARHIRRTEDKIVHIMKRHNIATAPVIRANKPIKLERKKRKGFTKKLF